MKRCLILLLPALFAGLIGYSQLVNNGATITVQSGATIKCTGVIINNSGGTITNAGTVSSDGELRNESGGTLAGAGTYESTTKFINNGNAFTGLNLRLIGSVNTDSIKTGAGSSFANVNLAKGAGNTATLSDAMTLTGTFTFENDNNKLILEDENLILGTSATIQNPDNNQFVVTNNTGTVTKQSLGSTAFVYPVGSSATEFNPITISNSGTADNISVRCMPDVLANGLSGSVVTSDFAKNAWVVTEGTPGGSNLTMTGQWTVGDEGTNFNRLKVGVARYNTGTDWDLPASNVIAASGSDPYNRTRSGITSTGVFAVADLDKVNTARLSLKVFLQGPYNTITGNVMNDGLRNLNLIPTTQPYSAALATSFTRVGVYDGTTTVNETVPSTAVFDVTGTNDDIIDWVYISLNDATTPSTKLQTRAALLQRDGDIVEYDPVSATYGPVRMPIDADGNYYLAIAHRNHLGIRTAAAPLLQDNVTFTYNFTTSQAQAYQNTTIAPIPTNGAMKDLGSGVFGMWAGNVNPDLNSVVNYTGLNNDALAILGALGSNQGLNLTNTYNKADVNLSGNVNYTGLNNDALFLLGVLGGNQGGIVRQHLY